jgi:DNA end-binding protein Ku
MAARSIGSGTIAFGLVSIPFKLYTAASPKNVSFNLLHGKCGGRMKQQYFCPVDNEIVPREQMVKGFEHARDQFVRFTDEELKKLESPKTDELELVEFVPQSTVDLLYIEKSYYLGPDKGGDRAYRLLSESMERTGKIAVGRYFSRGREQTVLVRPYKKGLILHYVYYADEVRSFDEVETGGAVQFKDIEVQLAEKLIAQLEQPEFDVSKYRDAYQDRVRAAIDAKVSGNEVLSTPEAPKAQVLDLLEALSRSIGATPAAPANEAKTEAAAAPVAATGTDATTPAAPAAATAKPPKKAEPRAKAAAGEKKKSAG